MDFFNVARVAGGFTFGEGPVYDRRRGYLLFCDAQGDAIYKLLPDDKLDVFYSFNSK